MGLLLAIAGVQIVVYYLLPRASQTALALNHRSPELLSWWTHAYVHAHIPQDAHLWGNLRLFALAVIPAWILYLVEDRRKRFWLAMAIFLFVVPILLAAISHVFYRWILDIPLHYGRGFSGVVSAVGGFLFMSTVAEIESQQSKRISYAMLGYLLLFLFLGIAVEISVSPSPVIFGGIAAVTQLVIAVGTATDRLAAADELWHWARTHRLRALLVCVGAYVGVMAFVAAFPSDLTQGGNLVNFAAHGAGLLVGVWLGGRLSGFDSSSIPTE